MIIPEEKKLPLILPVFLLTGFMLATWNHINKRKK